MNLTVILICVVLWGASAAGAFFYGQRVGADHEIAASARDDKIATEANEAAARAVASAVARIDVKQVTIRQELEREVHEKVVFRDCHSGDNAVRMLNSLPAVAPSAAGSGELPASGPSH